VSALVNGLLLLPWHAGTPEMPPGYGYPFYI